MTRGFWLTGEREPPPLGKHAEEKGNKIHRERGNLFLGTSPPSPRSPPAPLSRPREGRGGGSRRHSLLLAQWCHRSAEAPHQQAGHFPVDPEVRKPSTSSQGAQQGAPGVRGRPEVGVLGVHGPSLERTQASGQQEGERQPLPSPVARGAAS